MLERLGVEAFGEVLGAQCAAGYIEELTQQ